MHVVREMALGTCATTGSGYSAIGATRTGLKA